MFEEADSPQAPTVLFFPLVNDTFKKYKAPGESSVIAILIICFPCEFFPFHIHYLTVISDLSNASMSLIIDKNNQSVSVHLNYVNTRIFLKAFEMSIGTYFTGTARDSMKAKVPVYVTP